MNTIKKQRVAQGWFFKCIDLTGWYDLGDGYGKTQNERYRNCQSLGHEVRMVERVTIEHVIKSNCKIKERER